MSRKFLLVLLSLYCFFAVFNRSVFAYITVDFLDYPVPKEKYLPGSYNNRSFLDPPNHLGDDINPETPYKNFEGFPIEAIGNGKIAWYTSAGGYGELVAVIEHDFGKEVEFTNGKGNTVKTRYILSIYGHIRKNEERGDEKPLTWQVGDEIKRGQIIGYINDDAHNDDGEEHLHLGIRLSSQAIAQKRDPGKWFRGYDEKDEKGEWKYRGDFAQPSHVIEKLPGPSILDQSIYPNTASLGDILTFVYNINNPTSGAIPNVRLGARIRKSEPQGSWIDDPSRDKVVTLQPGAHNYSRDFQISKSVDAGLYDAQWVTLHHGTGVWIDSKKMSQILQVTTPIKPTERVTVDLYFNKSRFTTGDVKDSAVVVSGSGYTVKAYALMTKPDGTQRYAYYSNPDFQPTDPLCFSDAKRPLYDGTWDLHHSTWLWNRYTFTGDEPEGTWTWQFWYEDVNNPGVKLASDTETYIFTKILPGEQGWIIQSVDSEGCVDDISLALDSQGYAHISYHDDANDDLKYARWNGTSWIIETVGSKGQVGYSTSIALDPRGYPHISYYDLTNGDLKYARWDGTGWIIETVDSQGCVGHDTSIALDSQDYSHISYDDNTNYDLKYARWNGTGWSIQTVESEGKVGAYTSIALDSQGYAHISYLDGWPNFDLKYARSTAVFTVSAYCAQIKLKDGSIVVGDFGQDKLRIKTPYGELTISLKDIISIIGGEVKLKDGTILRGSIVDKELSVKTRYGELKIPTNDISSVIFTMEEEAALLSSPEKTIETYYGACLDKNVDLALICFSEKLRKIVEPKTQEERKKMERWLKDDGHRLKNWKITEKRLIDNHALVKVKASNTTGWFLLRKNSAGWGIIGYGENRDFPEYATELLQKSEVGRKEKRDSITTRAQEPFRGPRNIPMSRQASGRILFVHNNQASATQFKTVLEEAGFSVSLLPEDNFGLVIVADADLVIIDATCSGGPSAFPMAEDKKIIAMGNSGAYSLWAEKRLLIGQDYCHDTSLPKVIYIPESISKTPFAGWLQEPCPIKAIKDEKGGALITICAGKGRLEHIAIYDKGSFPKGTLGLGRESSDLHHWMIAKQGNYVLWGIESKVDDLTDEGLSLFINLCDHLIKALGQAVIFPKKTFLTCGTYQGALKGGYEDVYYMILEKVGLLSIQLQWQRNYPMMLLMSHPHWERKDGYSPLIIEYPVKEKDLGAELEVSIHSFSLLAGEVCPYEIKIEYRKNQSKEKQYEEYEAW